MSYSGILAKLKTILQGATGVSANYVHDYSRHASDWSVFLSLFKDTNKIHGYEITRRSLLEDAETSRTNKATHTFLIRGYYSLDDSAGTEKTFQGILENIRTAFRNQITLDDTVLYIDPLQIIIFENRMFGSVLCHYTEINLSVTEEVQWT